MPAAGQVGTGRFRNGRHRLETMRPAPSLEMGEIGGIGAQRRRGVGRRLIIICLGLGDREGGARR
jgi:hypothetical protein